MRRLHQPVFARAGPGLSLMPLSTAAAGALDGHDAMKPDSGGSADARLLSAPPRNQAAVRCDATLTALPVA